MRKKYFKVTPPSWVPQLSIILQGAILSDFGGMYSIRKQFYHQVDSWDGETITEELVESMPFLRLLYLFHKLGYFKASQVNRSPVAGKPVIFYLIYMLHFILRWKIGRD